MIALLGKKGLQRVQKIILNPADARFALWMNHYIERQSAAFYRRRRASFLEDTPSLSSDQSTNITGCL